MEKMEDPWFSIEEDSISSHNSSSYSDKIDSDIEAELYSVIHYQENLCSGNDPYADSIHTESSQIVSPVTSILENAVRADNRNTETGFIKPFRSYFQHEMNALAKNHQKCNLLNAQIFSTPLKRKSGDNFEVEDSVSVIEYSDDAKSKSFEHTVPTNKKETKRIKINSTNKLSSVKRHDTIMDSSDSDSVIWTDHDFSDNYSMKMNLYSTVCISSDSSDNSLAILSPIARKESKLNNQSMPNIKIGENSKDPWYINNEDLNRTNKRSGRYHEHITRQCSNCNKKDHLSKFCPIPKVIKCFICGGPHAVAKCKNRICGKCHGSGHDSRRCWKDSTSYCLHCRMKGHIRKDCPDIWRRYHLTTQPTRIVQSRQMKQNRTLYCFNCGSPGHFGAICKERNYRNPSTWPCVISYDNPEDLLMMEQKRWSKLADVNQNFQTYGNLNQRCQLNKGQTGVDSYRKQLNTPENNVNQYEREQLNVPQDCSKRRKRAAKKYNNKKIKCFQGIRNVAAERDFPRTPKPAQDCVRDPMPDFVAISEQQTLKKKQKNRRRRLQRNRKKLRSDNS